MGSADESTIEALMSAYTRAWNDEDLDAIEAFYNVPFFSYKDGALETWTNAESAREVDRTWIEANRREGPARWERLQTTITVQGRNAALITTHWVFRRPSGDNVWEFVDSFQLCRFGGSWRFVSRILHD